MRLTVLMYHQVGETPSGAVHRHNWITSAQFEAHLGYLSEAGYRSIDLEDWARPDARLPDRPLVITFDDGHKSVADAAWPLVRRHGFGAMTFLVASEIGGTNRWDGGEVSQPLLDAEDVAALAREGMRFGSHGWTHRRFRTLDGHDLREELVHSRNALSDLLGAPVQCISYPYNSSDARVHAAAHAAGYIVGVTGRGKINPRRVHPLGLRRVRPHPHLDHFRATLLKERCLRW